MIPWTIDSKTYIYSKVCFVVYAERRERRTEKRDENLFVSTLKISQVHSKVEKSSKNCSYSETSILKISERSSRWSLLCFSSTLNG